MYQGQEAAAPTFISTGYPNSLNYQDHRQNKSTWIDQATEWYNTKLNPF
jgi:hypothetical protein